MTCSCSLLEAKATSWCSVSFMFGWSHGSRQQFAAAACAKAPPGFVDVLSSKLSASGTRGGFMTASA